MILDEITAAKQAKQQRLLIGLCVVLLLSCLAVIVLYGASHVSLSKSKQAPASSPARPAAEPTPMPEGSDEELRKAYLDAFSHYENELKPALAGIDIQQWDPTRADTLKQQEQQAITAFGNGDYGKALQGINTLINTAETTLSDSQNAFDNAMQQAQSGYDNLDYASAKLAIDTALMHQAESTKAQELAQQIEQIPKIVELTEAIRIAKVENNPTQELAHIEELLAITPDDDALKQRASSLRTQLAEARFSKAISQAYQAIERQDANQARQALQQAKQIYPERPETTQVGQALAKLESQLRFEQHQRLANSARNADNWTSAEQELTLALQERPGDKTLSEQLATAKRINSLQQEMSALLQSPYRLSNDAVKASANAALLQADTVTSQSPALAKLAQQLKSTMTAVNKPVAVTVVSDGETHVSVRGVGQVGVITSKVIELKPGKYTFEGKRAGYTSKLLEVTIPMNQSSYQVSIVANERI